MTLENRILTQAGELDIIRKAAATERERAFSSMRMISRLSDAELKQTGFKSKESAVYGFFCYSQKKIDDLICSAS